MKEFEKPRMALLPLAEYKETLERLRRLEKLCARAADALDVMTQFLLISDVPLEWEENKRRENRKLIDELRKAAE